jgi:hypothetical protein
VLQSPTKITPSAYIRERDSHIALTVTGTNVLGVTNAARTAALKWFRESVNSPAAALTDGKTTDPSKINLFNAATPVTFSKDTANSTDAKSIWNGTITADQNARYWVLATYTDGTDTIYDIKHYDVKNIFTTVPVWMSGYDENSTGDSSVRINEFENENLAPVGSATAIKTAIPFDLAAAMPHEDEFDTRGEYAWSTSALEVVDLSGLSAEYANVGLAYDEVELYPERYKKNLYAWEYSYDQGGTKLWGAAATGDKFPTIALDDDFLHDNDYYTNSDPQYYVAWLEKDDDVYKKIQAEFVDEHGNLLEDSSSNALGMDILVPINLGYEGTSAAPDFEVAAYEHGSGTDYTGEWDSKRFYGVGGAIKPPLSLLDNPGIVPRGWYVTDSGPDSTVDLLSANDDQTGLSGYVRRDDFYGIDPLLRVDSGGGPSDYELTDNNVFYIVYAAPSQVQVITSQKSTDPLEDLGYAPVTSGIFGAEDYTFEAYGALHGFMTSHVAYGVEAYWLTDGDVTNDIPANRTYLPYTIINHSDGDDEQDVPGGADNYTEPKFKGAPWESQDAFFGITIENDDLKDLLGEKIYVNFYYEPAGTDGIPTKDSVTVTATWREWKDGAPTGVILDSWSFDGRVDAVVYVPNDAESRDDVRYDGYGGTTPFDPTGFGDAGHTLQYGGHEWEWVSTHVGADLHHTPYASDILERQSGTKDSDYIFFDYEQVNAPGSGSSGGGGSSVPAPKPEPEPTPAPTPEPDFKFIDVAAEDWFHDAVYYAFDNGLMVGTGADTFSPNTPMTRGMLVTVLGRLTDIDITSYDDLGTPFTDVSPAQYYAPYIAWARENGIVMGVGENRFEPDRDITRQEMAAVFTRYMAFMKINPVVSADYRIFTDEDAIDDYAKQPIQVLNKLGIILGVGNNTIDPAGPATRAQVAAMLHRFMENVR